MTGLVCAHNIVDSDGNNEMNLCIPTADCGVNEDYVSAERGITFAMTDSIMCT